MFSEVVLQEINPTSVIDLRIGFNESILKEMTTAPTVY